MPGSSTIVIARDDLSIPGSEHDRLNRNGSRTEVERRFFELIWESRPDVIVLDLGHAKDTGIESIRKVRERCNIPILVVCAESDVRISQYRIAGAAECMYAPVDIVAFNQTIQQIIELTGRPEPHPSKAITFVFGGLAFRPDRNTLSGSDGSSIRLTTSENDILCYFLSRPGKVCSRGQIAESLYGRHRPTSDRAIDVIINRLRKKLASVRGDAKHELLKTEFRRGYMLVADVSSISPTNLSQTEPV